MMYMDFIQKIFLLLWNGVNKELIVRRHIVGGANCTLISGLLPPRLHSHVGDRRLWAEQPHIVVALFERQDSCF